MLKIFFMICLLFTSNSHAQTSVDLTLYDQNKLNEFIQQHTELLKTAENGHVYFNLGNAYYRQGDIGRSMAAYLKAKQLLPRDADVKENLRFVHSKIKDKLNYENDASVMSNFYFWKKIINSKELYLFAVILLSISILCFTAFLLVKNIFVKQVGIAVLAMSSFMFVIFTVDLATAENWGSVVTNDAKIYSGPGENNTVLFQLNAGAPIIKNRSDGKWFMITLSDGKKGWINQSQIAVF